MAYQYDKDAAWGDGKITNWVLSWVLSDPKREEKALMNDPSWVISNIEMSKNFPTDLFSKWLSKKFFNIYQSGAALEDAVHQFLKEVVDWSSIKNTVLERIPPYDLNGVPSGISTAGKKVKASRLNWVDRGKEVWTAEVDYQYKNDYGNTRHHSLMVRVDGRGDNWRVDMMEQFLPWEAIDDGDGFESKEKAMAFAEKYVEKVIERHTSYIDTRKIPRP